VAGFFIGVDMKIDKTQPFTVDRGTDAELEKTWNIIKENGIRFLTKHGPPFPEWIRSYFPHEQRFEFDGNEFYSCRSSKNNGIHYTPSEFHAKYGSKFDYPFELIGPVIELNGKYMRAVDSSKPMVLDGVKCYASDCNYPDHIVYTLFAITKSNHPFCTTSGGWCSAWVEVDAPDLKVFTRLMTADEIVALGAIWVKGKNSDIKSFNCQITFDQFDGCICFTRLNSFGCIDRIKICDAIYSKSSTATNWLKFEVTEVVK
jgi:hypothetical protein